MNIKNIKIFLGISYFCIVLIFLWFFFKNFSIQDFTSYDLIKQNMDSLQNLKKNNVYVSSITFVIFTIVWIFLLGFAAPIFLIGGFFFGKWLGSILVIFSLSVGATLFYIFVNFFLKDLVKEKFGKKYSFLITKFEKNEFLYFLIYRLIGGIPFVISNIIPVLFSIKIRNFLFGTLFGMAPQLFIGTSLGSGIEKVIKENLDPPSFFDLILSPDIYFPLIGFFILILIGFIFKKFFNN
tara:strand:+ start:3484 stop:4197 length:714 start_codon:yes stop_codon:yes gene_type:complete